MAILDQLKAKAITTAVDMAIDLLYEDFDGGLPKVRSALNRFVGSGDEAPERLTERILLMLDGTLEGSLRRLSRNPDGKTPNSSYELHG